MTALLRCCSCRFAPFLFVALTVVSLGACEKQRPLPPESITGFDPSRLDATRAFEEVRAFVSLGPRDAGTEGARIAAEYLLQRLQTHGFAARLESFEDDTPHGPATFRNVIGVLPGRNRDIVILASHYDTKSGIAESFTGANDSGSSTGLLLELARTLNEQAGPSYPGPEIRFVFFDGEEAREQYGPRDGFHGSRHYADRLAAEDVIPQVKAVVVLDMVGDTDLSVTLPRNSNPTLRAATLDAAHAEGVRDRFRLYPYVIGDDHEAFLQRGIPALDIIDFQYGSRPGRNDYWHTPEDTMDKISSESLGVIGRVTIRVINSLR